MGRREARGSVLGAVRNPLIFFSLALLVIEGIIGVVVANSQMTGPYQFASVCIMAGLFLVVVLTVALITVKWPKHLYEEILRELESSRRVREVISSPGFRDTIEDIVATRVRPECLCRPEEEGSN
ncbi:MAG: hypothetical protein FJ290_07820 [Planctomycetes bacterium]|nr:hypothetical protein [Planctomycetota bacterium]